MLTIPYAPGKNNFFTKFQFFNFGNIELNKSRQCERRPIAAEGMNIRETLSTNSWNRRIKRSLVEASSSANA